MMGSNMTTLEAIFPDGSDHVPPLSIGITNLAIFVTTFPLSVHLMFTICNDKTLWKLAAYRILLQITVVNVLSTLSTFLIGLIALFDNNVVFNPIVIAAIFKDTTLWKFPAYRVIFHMTVVTVLSGLSTLILGLIALFDRFIAFPQVLIVAGAVIAYYGPTVLCLLSAIQAFNRFVVIVEIQWLTKMWIYTVLIVVAWAFMIASAVAMMLTGTVYSYTKQDYLYYYDYEEPGHSMLFYVSISALLGGAVLFLLAIGRIVFLRGKTEKRDIHLLIQGIIPFIYLALIRTLTRFPIPNRSSKVIFFMSLAFRSMPAVYLLVYLILNRTLRHAMKRSITPSETQATHVMSLRSNIK